MTKLKFINYLILSILIFFMVFIFAYSYYLKNNIRQFSCEEIISSFDTKKQLIYRVKTNINVYDRDVYVDLYGYYGNEKINRKYKFYLTEINNDYKIKKILESKYHDDELTNEDKISFLSNDILDFSVEKNDDILILNDHINPMFFCVK